MSVMTTLTIKLPEELKARLKAEARLTGKSVSAVVRRELQRGFSPRRKGTKKPSLLDVAGDLAGRGDSGITDLATNPKYMKGFGEWRH